MLFEYLFQVFRVLRKFFKTLTWIRDHPWAPQLGTGSFPSAWRFRRPRCWDDCVAGCAVQTGNPSAGIWRPSRGWIETAIAKDRNGNLRMAVAGDQGAREEQEMVDELAEVRNSVTRATYRRARYPSPPNRCHPALGSTPVAYSRFLSQIVVAFWNITSDIFYFSDFALGICRANLFLTFSSLTSAFESNSNFSSKRFFISSLTFPIPLIPETEKIQISRVNLYLISALVSLSFRDQVNLNFLLFHHWNPFSLWEWSQENSSRDQVNLNFPLFHHWNPLSLWEWSQENSNLPLFFLTITFVFVNYFWCLK